MTLDKATQIMLLLAGTGCAPPPLCSTKDDCNDVAADGEPPPDLPCGGADLLTDDANCGACGHACDVVDLESPYSSGHCIDGQCGPIFSQCGLVAANATCADECQGNGGTCIPRGCPGVKNEGVTALLYYNANEWTQCLPNPPDEEFTQDCDEPIPMGTVPSCCCL